MPVTAARRHQDPDDEAKLLLVFIAVAAIAGVGYICYARLHIRKEQLMEASLYRSEEHTSERVWTVV